jgi:hypothetical protein
MTLPVDALAELAGLTLHPDHRAGTIENLERLAAMAQLFLDFPLEREIAPANVFSHDGR